MSDYEDRESITLINEGLKIFGILHIPKKRVNPPCVLFCHGLGGNKIGHYRVYVELAKALVQMGIAVLRFDYRGSGDSEGDFGEATLHGEISDALVALRYLFNESRIDHQRIGIFGRSLGGTVAVLAASSFGKLKSIALWSPVYNGAQWSELWKKALSAGVVSEDELVKMRTINGQVASLSFYGELFSIQIEEALKELNGVPLLLIHGEKDQTVHSTHSDNYLEFRKDLKGKTELIKLPESNHEYAFAPEREKAIIETAHWFRRTL